jgi:high-affinity iron transporter
MLSVTLILFRESLEAALFIGILLAALENIPNKKKLVSLGIVLGVIGSLLMAILSDRISSSLDGQGSDYLNIVILGIAICMLIWHCIYASQHGKEMSKKAKNIGTATLEGESEKIAITTAVALTVLREGSESVLFLMSYAHQLNPFESMIGTVVGLGSGIVVGAITFLGISRLPIKNLFKFSNLLITFFTAGLASQLAKIISQAGVIDYGGNPIWDTSFLLSNDSKLGAVLHILIGYEATPSLLQICFYVALLMVIYIGSIKTYPTNSQ